MRECFYINELYVVDRPNDQERADTWGSTCLYGGSYENSYIS